MAMGPERDRERSSPSSSSSKPLHNFNLPFGLRWGNQKFMRCMKINSNGEISAVQRRPSSSGSVNLSAAVNASNGNGNGNLNAPSSADFVSIIGKRKEREKFDDPSVVPVDNLRGSDFRKVGLDCKPPHPPLPSSPVGVAATESRRKIRSAESGNYDGIAAVREKLMFDLQTAADKLKDSILREGLEKEEDDFNPPLSAPAPATVVATVASTAAASETAEAAVRPWNLRTRRSACKAPTGNGYSSGGAGTSNGGTGVSSPAKSLKVDLVKSNSGASPSRATENNKSSPRLRSGGPTTMASPSGDKNERAKFSVSLTRREIEEDFLAMASRRPPRRPQKRSKYIQKNLDTLFPGLWLTEITADMYKVPETQ